MKRILTASLAVVFAAAMCIPLSAIAEGIGAGQSEGSSAPEADATATEQAVSTTSDITQDASASIIDDLSGDPLAHMESTEAVDAAEAANIDAADDQTECTLTIIYTELISPETPDGSVEAYEMGRYVVDGLHPGDVINVWDYVFDIPGHFFFDGSAASLTISSDNSKNVVELLYGVLQNSEFTVDYYVMDGADLTADTWSEALATDPSFYKVGEQKFVNQTFNKEIVGSDFERDMDGLYAVGSYPSSIKLTEDPDENVINVLYVPAMTNLPSEWEIIEKPETPEGGTDSAVPPTTPNEVLVPTPILPDGSDIADFVAPPQQNELEGVAFSDGNIVEAASQQSITFTDDMVKNPITPQTAERYAQAYKTGAPLITPLPVVTNMLNIQIGFALVLFLIAFLAICTYAFERGQRGKM